MRVLLIGSGGREHALAWAISRSPRLGKLFIAPGNGGTAGLAESVAVNIANHAEVMAWCKQERIDLVAVGPEAPLVAGIADDLEAAGIKVFGPHKAAAQLEGSKAFTKMLCDEMDIPTARYARFDRMEAALAYVREQGVPIVVKADGLAAGKGVTVAETVAEAEAAVRDCFSSALGEAGASVVIEECLVGEEASVFAVCDGARAVLLSTAQDHKRANDGDTGPNTGGMGAYSPAPVMTEAMLAEVEQRIIMPKTVRMALRVSPFSCVLYSGLSTTSPGPPPSEYTVWYDDPQFRVPLRRRHAGILDLLEGAATGDLEGVMPEWSDEVALTVVMAARGYPGTYAKGSEIRGLDGIDGDGVRVFHAGTVRADGRVLANGGRVLNVTATGGTVAQAQARAYEAVGRIDWPEGFCRRDIGWRAVAREQA